jgi:uncharacterized protein (TIGR03000 family)
MKPTRYLWPACVASVLLFSAALCRAEPLTGWTSGYPLDIRPLVPVRAYAASTWVSGESGSLAAPIFMTSINYPGVYGAYSFNWPPDLLNREPMFYPYRDPRMSIPAVTITTEPFRTVDTPTGAATLYAAPPSVTPAIPGSTALSTTYPRQLPAVPVETSENSARVVVRLPEDALLEFQGVPIEGSGRVRKFTTVPLTPRRPYHYEVRAIWTENGREVVQDRHVTLHAGQRVDVDFITPPPAEPPEQKLRTEPLPPIPTTPPLVPTLPPRRG